MNRILRIRNVIERYGKSRSPIYADIQAGTFPKPIKLGARASGWPEVEIEQIIAARIAGKKEEEIRALVRKLHRAREDASWPVRT